MTSFRRPEPLITGPSQFDVDFVIPRKGVDLPVGIDPFLMFKSRDPLFQSLHSHLVDLFNKAIGCIARGDLVSARDLLRFPEAFEIGFGYSQGSRRGAGIGAQTAELLIEAISNSPQLQQRGVRHIEEMQLVSVGIGRDRISDISANILKSFLAEYTKKQCDTWGLDTRKGVPLANVLDLETKTWYDTDFDLPVSDVDGLPILFVPRRIVRTLPWINYQDFFRSDFSPFHRPSHTRSLRSSVNPSEEGQDKRKAVQVTRSHVERIDQYVRHKEHNAKDAQPSLEYLELSEVCKQSDELWRRLQLIEAGAAQSTQYQLLILEILNFLFNPELIDGEPEVRTIDGTERRDIIFTNDSDKTFWDYIRGQYGSLLLMFETKNTRDVETSHLNQIAMYLGDRIGRLGVLVSRNAASDARMRKAIAAFNDGHKVILFLSDADVHAMLEMKCAGTDAKAVSRISNTVAIGGGASTKAAPAGCSTTSGRRG